MAKSSSRHLNSTPSVRSKRGSIVGRDRLIWRTTKHGLSLHYGMGRQPLVRVQPDADWPGMHRIELPDGRLSDMVNLTRAKDAAFGIEKFQGENREP
jgi:hypothetical protein